MTPKIQILTDTAGEQKKTPEIRRNKPKLMLISPTAAAEPISSPKKEFKPIFLHSPVAKN